MEELISVIIPTYNQSELLLKAIESVRNQTYKKIEILVIDDYGTDNLEIKMRKLMETDCRIKYLCNNKNKGVSGARNTGINESKGNYIAFLDSDDEWTDNHLESLLKKLKDNKVDVGFCLWYEGRHDNMNALGNQQLFKNLLARAENDLNVIKGSDFYIFDRDFFQYTIITYFYCYHLNTMLIKKERLIASGEFDESLNSSEDCKLLFTILNNNKFLLLMEHQYFYYYWAGSTYSFIDRSNINIHDIVQNEKVVEKLTLQGEDKIKVRRYSWELAKKSKFCNRKMECKRVIQKAIHNKYITLGIINQKYDLNRSLKYLIKAFIAKRTITPIILMVKILNNKIMNKTSLIEAQAECIDLY